MTNHVGGIDMPTFPCPGECFAQDRLGKGRGLHARTQSVEGGIDEASRVDDSDRTRRRRGGRTFVSEGSIKVVVAEDHPIARHGIVQLLEGTDEFVVVGEAPSGEAALDLAAEMTSGPAIFLVDLRLPGIDGLETTRRLASVCPDAGVVILTAFDDTRSMVEAVRAGAKAYVVKSARRDEILDTVRMVAHGHVVFASDVWDAVAEQGRKPARETARLTRREGQVLSLLSRGLSNREMADELGLSVETVKTHLERLYKRLGVNTRTDAVAKAFRWGLID